MKLPLHKTPIRTLLPAPARVEVVEENTSHKPEHFSYSQMAMYLRCSYQYWFRYVKGLKEPPNLNLGIGKGGHASLEWNARHKMSKGADMPTSDMLDLASDLIDVNLIDVEDSTPQDMGKAKDQTLAQVRVFRTKQAPLITPLAVEHKFEIIIPPDDDYPDEIMPVLGFIDTISEQPRTVATPGASPNIIAVEDYKFVGRSKSQIDIDTTPQLTLYDYVFWDTTQVVPDVIGLRQFTYTKDGPQVRASYRSRELMEPGVRLIRWERLKQQIRRVQAAIKAGIFIPTDDARTCSWCGYRKICQFSLIKT